MLRRFTSVHWLLAVVYGLLATGTLFTVCYQFQINMGVASGFGEVFAASPVWLQMIMKTQTWAFVVLLGFSIAFTGSLRLPFPPLKSPV